MARRKQEVILQRELETQEDWEDFLSKEGLLVIDVYQEWAGPCTSLVNNFKKLRNELSDDLLRYAVAKADRIESLVLYRGKCKPCFLFFAGGVLVNVIRGARYPLIRSTIINELAQEHKVLNGEARRVKVIDEELPFVKEPSVSEEEEKDEEDEGPPEVTVAIIKPDAVEDGHVDDIIEMMEAEGIEILANEKQLLSEETAREFYQHLSEEPFYEDYIEFMTSGPCHVLVLKKKNNEKGIIFEWKEKLGPVTVEEAIESTPTSLRAIFGTRGYMNALHGSDSPSSAMRELGFFFPQLSRTLSQRKTKKIERTLAIIRPDAYTLYKDEILEKIKEAGFEIALQKEILLSRSDVEEFYSHIIEEDYFEDLVEEMTSGPILALGLARESAVAKWREILGPTDKNEAFETDPQSLRAQFMVPETDVNLLHGSETIEDAEKEINFFFPQEDTVAVIKPEAFGTREEIMGKIQEAGFKITATKELVLNEDIINKMYKKDQPYYESLKKYLMTGPSMFMVLTREDAVYGFRQLLGPVDPLEAKNIDPNLFRAQFGTNKMQNALHACSSLQKAQLLKDIVFAAETPREESIGASGEMTPCILTSSESPVSVEYAIAREAAEEAELVESIVNIIPESSTEDVLEVESSVEIVGAKLSPVKEQQAVSTLPEERRQSEGMEGKDVTAEEITQEAQDEGSKPDEAAEEAGELPAMISELPEAGEETEKPPETAEETEKPPEAAEETEKPPEAVEETEKPPETAEVAEKLPEEAGETEKPPEAAEVTEKPPEAAGEIEKPPEAAGETEKPPEAVEVTEEPPEAAEVTEKPPEAVVETEKPPEAAEVTEEPPEAAEVTEKPPETAEVTEKPPEAAEEAEKPPEAAEETEKPPETAEVTEKPPEAAEVTEKPPEAAEETEKPPEAAEETEKPPETAEVTEKPPETAEETEKPPEAETAEGDSK